VLIWEIAWYLIARPEGSDSTQTYRVQRFRSIRKLDIHSEVPADFDVRECRIEEAHNDR
jgi:hypothetical protein